MKPETKNLSLLILSERKGFLSEHMSTLQRYCKIFDSRDRQQILNWIGSAGLFVVLVDLDEVDVSVLNKIRKTVPASQFGLIGVSEENDMLIEGLAFRWGFDHYLPQPVEVSSLGWRIQSVYSRLQAHLTNLPKGTTNVEQTLGPVVRFGPIEIDRASHLTKVNGKVILLPPVQYSLLLFFISHRDELLSREQLKEEIWAQTPISLRSIDAQISKLKRAIPELTAYLVNIYGSGYVLTQPPEKAA